MSEACASFQVDRSPIVLSQSTMTKAFLLIKIYNLSEVSQIKPNLT